MRHQGRDRSSVKPAGTPLAGGLLLLAVLAGTVLAVDEVVDTGSFALVAFGVLLGSAAGAGVLTLVDARRHGISWWRSAVGSVRTAARWLLELVV